MGVCTRAPCVRIKMVGQSTPKIVFLLLHLPSLGWVGVHAVPLRRLSLSAFVMVQEGPVPTRVAALPGAARSCGHAVARVLFHDGPQ